MSKLYVGGLPYQTTEEALRLHFEQVGNVNSARIIMDRDSGRSKGFGFIEMATAQDAQSAIQRFNGSDFGGRRIVVNEARPQEPRAPRASTPNTSFDNRRW